MFLVLLGGFFNANPDSFDLDCSFCDQLLSLISLGNVSQSDVEIFFLVVPDSEPDVTTGKKVYDREFLLQFRFHSSSMEKPIDLPPIDEIIMDKVRKVVCDQIIRPSKLRYRLWFIRCFKTLICFKFFVFVFETLKSFIDCLKSCQNCTLHCVSVFIVVCTLWFLFELQKFAISSSNRIGRFV